MARVTTKSKIVDQIAQEIAAAFPSFGGGRVSRNPNPLSIAMQDSPAAFALGVPVREVVLATLKAYERKRPQSPASSGRSNEQ